MVERSSSVHELCTRDAIDFFVQLNEFESSSRFWKEKARWIKYEENVEPSGNWGRPFLSYIEAECLLAFKQSLDDGLVLLGSVNDGEIDISYTISNMLVLGGHAEPRHRVRIQQIMTLPRMHQGESSSRFRKKVQLSREALRVAYMKREEAMTHAWDMSENTVRNRWVKLARKALDQQRREKGKTIIWENLLIENRCAVNDVLKQLDQDEHRVEYLNAKSPSIENISSSGLTESSAESHNLRRRKEEIKLRKIIHPESIGVVIFHAAVDFLKRDQCLPVFIRFQNEKPISDFMEIAIPIRFLYILFTSQHAIHVDGYQICRAVATLFKDRTFARYALRAKTSNDLIQAANMFVNGSVMLPPGNWKPELLIPVAGAISAISRKKHTLKKFKHREGKDLWRKLRAKLVVVSMMKGLVYHNGVKDLENTEELVTRSGAMSLPRRGDCPVKTRFGKVSRNENENDKYVDVTPDSCDIVINNNDGDAKDDEDTREIHPLHANGKWFGGLRREFRPRCSQYWSDIKDGFHIQCLASLFYLAISLTAMCLTYGQMMCKYTSGNLGPVEMLLATSLSCILIAAFATEPLSVIAGTAAMLLVEASTYQASKIMEIDFLQLRFLTGMWIFIFLLLILAFDKTHWIHYCTRFTEEILHVLVALLFMYEGIKNLIKVYEQHPLRKEYQFRVINSTVNTGGYEGSNEKPNTALLYTIFMFATFGIALGFRLFEKTRFFSPPHSFCRQHNEWSHIFSWCLSKHNKHS
ncbi:anion exchange protein 3-like [Dendronephthya gigantea]|uniref:anion exchange protein 3-like n=1 Tax=Dendronephthya gigantea TaxID=151771 RepID=UPI00106C2BF3|nr:anion exchange protein 3-like [Dendronephthya gigantea]